MRNSLRKDMVIENSRHREPNFTPNNYHPVWSA
jgi:hypothetical protein